MNLVWFLLPVALLLGFGFLAGCLWCIFRGQYDDLDTEAERMLWEDSRRGK